MKTKLVMIIKYKIALFIFLFRILPVLAQDYCITGIVKDSETKEPIPFCNVILFKTTKGTTTDDNGKFKINFPVNIPSKLIVSYVGYKSDTILITKDKNEYPVFLTAKQGALNEVVVTGVAKTTFVRENPVSIISVPTKMIERTSESNIIDALVTNVPGLNAVKLDPIFQNLISVDWAITVF